MIPEVSNRPVSSLRRFAVVWAGTVVGSAAVLPYAFHMQAKVVAEAIAQSGLPLWALIAISWAQTSVLAAACAGLGLLASRAAGLRTPILDTWLSGRSAGWRWLPLPVAVGILTGVVILLGDLALAPLMPPEFRQGLATAVPPAWMGLLASLYGGITEEVLLRVFLMGVVAWLMSRVQRSEQNLRPSAAWVSILVASLVFGLGHLPATASFAPLTGTVVLRALLLNGVGGVAFGWLYWRKGLVAAMVAHFMADVVLHVLSPLLAGKA